jgi:hypothetical protein
VNGRNAGAPDVDVRCRVDGFVERGILLYRENVKGLPQQRFFVFFFLTDRFGVADQIFEA